MIQGDKIINLGFVLFCKSKIFFSIIIFYFVDISLICGIYSALSMSSFAKIMNFIRNIIPITTRDLFIIKEKSIGRISSRFKISLDKILSTEENGEAKCINKIKII